MHPTARFAALALALAATSCAPRAPTAAWTEERMAGLDLDALIWQTMAPGVWASPSGGDEAVDALAGLDAWAEAGAGGVLLLGAPAGAWIERIDSLQQALELPLLVVADLDRGTGGVLAGGTELPSAYALGSAGESHRAGQVARIAAEEARAAGVHVALVRAPPFPHPVSLPAGGGHERGAQGVQEYARGLEDGGLMVGLRAFDPGTAPADGEVPVLEWDRAAVEVFQLELLYELARTGLAAVEPAPVALPALTGDTLPLSFSPALADGVMRRDLEFEGVVLADVSPAGPLVSRYGLGEAAVRALAGGADLLMGTDAPEEAVAAIAAAVEAGRLPRARVEGAVRRVFAAKEAAGLGGNGARGRPAFRPERHTERAREAQEAALLALGASAGETLRGCRAPVLATAPEAPLDVLTEALTAEFPALRRLETEVVALRGPLPGGEDEAQGEPDCVVAAMFPGAEPRIEPDPADAPAARRLVVLEFLPATDRVPLAGAPVLVVRGVGRQAQIAAARALAGRVEPAALAAGGAWPPAPLLRAGAPAEGDMGPRNLARIDAAVRAAIASEHLTAAAVVVGRRGVLVKATGYGAVAGEPVDPAGTVFDLASLTKVVGTTAALMALLEDGLVELDAPVRRYVEEFTGDGRERVTVRHLLTHTSGLPAGEWLYGRAGSAEEALEQVYRAPIQNPPGSVTRYSDFGMILLAELVRRRAGEPMDAFLVRRVFGPLGMSSTFFRPPEPLRGRIVPTATQTERPYVIDGVVHDGNAFRLGGVTGHAGLFSTATDVATFAQMLLNGGAYGAARVFQAGTVGAFRAPQPGAQHRALGWENPQPVSSAGRFFSASSYGHTGFTGTSLWIDPEREMFVVLLTNRTFARGTTAHMQALRRAVHEAAMMAVADEPISPRPGSRAAR